MTLSMYRSCIRPCIQLCVFEVTKITTPYCSGSIRVKLFELVLDYYEIEWCFPDVPIF